MEGEESMGTSQDLERMVVIITFFESVWNVVGYYQRLKTGAVCAYYFG